MAVLRNKLTLLRLLPLLLCAGALTACDSEDLTIPSWLGDGKPKYVPLPGERHTVLKAEDMLTADANLASENVVPATAERNTEWAQQEATSTSLIPNAQWEAGKRSEQSATAGEGNAIKFGRVITPVVQAGRVFVMDGLGYISAHDQADIDRVLWRSEAAVDKEEAPVLGGGLAVADGRLYAAVGSGKVIALDAASGAVVWQQAVNIPIRTSPKVQAGKVFVLSVDNQLMALDASNGNIVWSDRSITENAGFLTGASPSVTEEVVLVPYSSAEIKALSVEDGRELWSDSLIRSKRTFAAGAFTGIGASPVIADNIVYAVSNTGMMGAYTLQSGQRVWEQPISSVNAPVIAGDYVYVLTSDALLVALQRFDGRVKWVKPLPRFADEEEKKNPYQWSGPVLASDALIIVGAHGVLMRYNLSSGELIGNSEIPDHVTAPPIFANGTMYFIDNNARLHAQ